MRFAFAVAAALCVSSASAQMIDNPDDVPEISKPTAESDFPWRPAIAKCRQSDNLVRVRYCIGETVRGHVFSLAAWDDIGPEARREAVACADKSPIFYGALARCIRFQIDLAEQRRFLKDQEEWASRKTR